VWILCLKTLPKPLRICFLLSLPTPLRHKNKWNPKNQWTGLGSTGERNREKMAAAAALPLLLLGLAAALLAGRPARATDPSVFLDWDVSYITASPLGVPQKVRFLLPPPPLRSPVSNRSPELRRAGCYGRTHESGSQPRDFHRFSFLTVKI
jgi:hypothetical protein